MRELRLHVKGPTPRQPAAPGKPAQGVADWRRHCLPMDLRSFDPLDPATPALAHAPADVDGVLAGKIANGFGNRKPQVAASLPFTGGSMLAPARQALANGQVACAPVSGFHHAGHAGGGGFCTFNGLMIAALALARAGRAARVGIRDLDQHWGDGTHGIIGRLGLDWVSHHSPGPEAPSAGDAARCLRRRPRIVGTFHDCDLLLYQAGADAHVDDPLGSWMTNEQLAERERERIVIEVAATIDVPVAWNPAGGCQRDADRGIEPVLAIRRRTLAACAGVFAGRTDAGQTR